MPDQRCKGLAVRVAPSGVKTWDLAYRIRGTGKMRRLSLGRRPKLERQHGPPDASALCPAPFVSTAHTDSASALSQSFYVFYIGHG